MDPNALSNMNIASQGLNFISSLTPQDNDDGIGMSHKASKITSGISGGLDTASSIAGSINPIAGAAFGGVSGLFKMIKGAVDRKRENDRSITSRLAKKEYDPTQDNVGYSFGNGTAKYGMPLFGNGGIPSFASSDNTRTKLTPSQELTSKQLNDIQFQRELTRQQDKKIIEDRKARIETSNKYNKTPLSRTTKETISKSLEGTPDKFRIFPESAHSFIDDYLNPGVMIGTMAKNLAQSKSAKDYALSIGTPLTVGALAGLGTKTTGQFVNNVTNPLVGVKNPFEDIIRPKKVPLTAGQEEWILKHKQLEDILKKDPNADISKGLQDLKDNVSNFPNEGKIDLRKSDDYIKNRKEIIGHIDNENWKLSNKKIFDNLLSDQLNNSTVASKEFIKDNINTANKEWKESTKYMNNVTKGFQKAKNLQDESRLLNKPFKGDYAEWYKNSSEAASTNHNFDALLNNQNVPVKEGVEHYYNILNPKIPSEKLLTKDFYMRKNKYGGPIGIFELGGDPRAQADIEAEQGEAMQHSSGKIENIEGQKHENGGTPLRVQRSHKYIYSDSLGTDKNGNITLNEKDVVKSFADDAKGIQRKYSKREGDPIVDATKKFELDSLQQKAEQARVAKEQIEMGKQMKKYKAKYGANLKRFDTSGDPQQPSSTQPSSIMTPEEMKKMYDDLQLKAAEVTGGLNQTITDLQQTSKQLDNTNQQLQQSSTSPTKPTPQLQQSSTSPTKPTPQPLFGGGHRTDPFVGPRVPSRRDNLREAAHFYTPGPDAVKKNGFFGDLTTGDKIQLSSMLPAFGFNMDMGLRKADVEPNRKNLYDKDVVNIMQNRKFDIQNYLNQSNLATNTAKEDIGNNSTSVNGKIANLQKLFANQSNALGDITTKGQEMNNQYRAEEANTKNIIGEANRAESIRAAGINDQNKARKQQFLAKAFEQMGQGIATTGQSANQSLTNKLLIKSLSEISPDFDVKNMKDLQVGDDGYIVFKGVKTEFKMSDEGKIVMAGGTPNTANAAKSQYAPKEFTMKAFPNFTKTKTK